MTWEITGPNLPPLRIRADTFSQALKKSKLRDPNYCAGYMADDN
jgi:hypothetical protein